MKSREKKLGRRRYIFFLLIVALGAILLISYLTYQPPLLRTGLPHPFEFIYDYFGFGWHYTKSVYLEQNDQLEASQHELALAAWHRPNYYRVWFNLDPGDLFRVGKELEKLGFRSQVSRVLFNAYLKSGCDQRLGQELLQYFQNWNEWSKVAVIAEDLAREGKNPDQAYYWWGRALYQLGKYNEAESRLQKALQNNSPRLDTRFYLARACEKLGELVRAQAYYEKLVEESPVHLGGWQALERIYLQKGAISRANQARVKAGALIPRYKTSVNFSNEISLRGYDLVRNNWTEDSQFRVTLYSTRSTTQDNQIKAMIRLISSSGHSIMEEINLPDQVGLGEVVKLKICRDLPWDMHPTKYNLQVAFSRSDNRLLRIIGSKDCWLNIQSIQIKSRVREGFTQSDRLTTIFGENILAINKQFVLAGNAELTIDVEDSIIASGLGIVSYTRYGLSFFQGESVAEIQVDSVSGDRYVFSLKAGLDTSDQHLEVVPEEQRHHHAASIFDKRVIQYQGDSYNACRYFSCFQFPGLIRPKSVKFKYVYPHGGSLYIDSFVFLKAKEELPSFCK
ncbi:MAG: tetratricopeptide repeat protein [Candidatus Euphemobacter frigidus]|nr:tetratricopeptide repeat protein [Candidatus Euphemobacter frigidus]MDP8276375.1 tetratricopeptide repeat protein [Candidatus Euphemobacter frigidus]